MTQCKQAFKDSKLENIIVNLVESFDVNQRLSINPLKYKITLQQLCNNLDVGNEAQ